MALILIAAEAPAVTTTAAAVASEAAAHTHLISYCVCVRVCLCIHFIRARVCVRTEDAKLPLCISRLSVEYICLLKVNQLFVCVVSFRLFLSLTFSKICIFFFGIVQLVDLFERFFTIYANKCTLKTCLASRDVYSFFG